MPKSQFNLAGYALVADRITEFYDRFQTGRIVTDLMSRDPTIVFKAEVYRHAEDALPAATGWASEREGDGEINEVACLENSETSAIGRALANLGFTASRLRPSYEEMQKAERARLRLQSSARPSAERTDGQAGLQVSEPKQNRPPSRAKNDSSTPERDAANATLGEAVSNRTSDVLVLLSEAGKAKIPGQIIVKFREQIANGFLTLAELDRMERQLRHWIVNGFSPSPGKTDSGGSAHSVNTSPH